MKYGTECESLETLSAIL